MYLTQIVRIKAHKIKDRTPKIFAGSRLSPCSGAKHSLKAYRGEVPMSPKTIPRAPMAKVSRLSFSVDPDVWDSFDGFDDCVEDDEFGGTDD